MHFRKTTVLTVLALLLTIFHFGCSTITAAENNTEGIVEETLAADPVEAIGALTPEDIQKNYVFVKGVPFEEEALTYGILLPKTWAAVKMTVTAKQSTTAMIPLGFYQPAAEDAIDFRKTGRPACDRRQIDLVERAHRLADPGRLRIPPAAFGVRRRLGQGVPRTAVRAPTVPLDRSVAALGAGKSHQPSLASKRISSSAAVARTTEPDENSPSRMLSEIGFSISRSIVRRIGRAPYLTS